MNIKVKNLVRRVAKGKLKKARFYAAFRVSQSPKYNLESEEWRCIKEFFNYVIGIIWWEDILTV